MKKIIPNFTEIVYTDFFLMEKDIELFCKNYNIHLVRYDNSLFLQKGIVCLETGTAWGIYVKNSRINNCLDKFNNYILDTSDSFILDFIRKNPRAFCWNYASLNYNLSKEFIKEFYDEIDFYCITINKNISKEIKDFCRMFI